VRVLEVFADVWCPFTHVGLRRLIEERDRRGPQRRCVACARLASRVGQWSAAQRRSGR